MPLSDQARLAAERQAPRIVALWQAVTALRSVVSFMNTGAHPDDETSAMLAALRFRDGIDISYACSTRGEGGQNDIGTEVTEALGVLRTAEMEAACDRLDLRMYWLSEHPDDSIFDFGFSKSGEETLARWGHARTLSRFVRIIRTERPDIICPTFLDVPGQHGHHRAMTQAALEAMELAADPDFDCDLPPWTVSKLYLPAWSGAGQAYDDDLPPPPATLRVPATGRDPVTGWSFARMGQQSRAMHRTQAMGRWVATGSEVDFPLHLARTRVAGPDDTVSDGLPQTLADLGLKAAQERIDAAIAAFPDADAVLQLSCEALALVRQRDAGPLDHKLARKEEQLGRVIRLAAGVEAHGVLGKTALHPGDAVPLTIELETAGQEVTVTPNLPQGWVVAGDQLRLGADAATSDPYPSVYLTDTPAAPRLQVSITAHGVTSTSALPFVEPPVVLPRDAAKVTPAGDIINLAAGRRCIRVALEADSTADLQVPAGWRAVHADGGFDVTAPQDVAPGLYALTLTMNGRPAQNVRWIARDHITPRALTRPAQVLVRVLDAALPDVQVGYVGGGNDRVGHWLSRLGVEVADLSQVPLTDAVLDVCDTLVIGIFAMKFRPGLAEAIPRIHDWMRAGGTLVTLYHRPWDNWDPETTPPYRLEIGQPSLRWRVTDENAAVTHLAPAHPLFNTPNVIGFADWEGWHKERGLYFAKDWDPAYIPLVEMADPDEAPQHGAWLAADVGQGRHVHTSLILHHQMEKLTPGAFRIMANLIAKRG